MQRSSINIVIYPLVAQHCTRNLIPLNRQLTVDRVLLDHYPLTFINSNPALAWHTYYEKAISQSYTVMVIS
jgi:hypothetical protein